MDVLTSFDAKAGTMAGTANFWGGLIRSLREDQRLSQRELAQYAKVNRSTLRRIEDGIARNDIETIERLLEYLGYELEALEKASIEERLKRWAIDAKDPEKRSRMARNRILNTMLLG